VHLVANYHSTTANQLNSPLLSLPAELRNDIYKLVFTTNTILVTGASTRFLSPRTNDSTWAAALLLTCRQINDEATALFWQLSTFDLRQCHYPDELRAMVGSDKCAMVGTIAMSGNLASAIAGWVQAGRVNHRALFSGGLTALDKVCVEGPLSWDLEGDEVSRCVRVCFDKKGLEVMFEI